MGAWTHAIVIIFSSVFGGGGFASGAWTFLERRDKRKQAVIRLSMGFAYSQITSLGTVYLRRGSITVDEYEDYRHYYFDPYHELGGNGVAERMMQQVSNLPFASHNENVEIFGNHEERIYHNVPVISSPR